MKSKLFILLFIFGFCRLFAQTEVDKFYFLMGTLDERFLCGAKNKNLINYYSENDPLLKYNYALFKNEFPDLKIDASGTELLSEKLAEKINTHYKFIYDEGVYCSDGENENGEPLDSLYNGHLKPELIKTYNQKLSYILGAYVCYGKIKDGKYIISIPNSANTFPVCVDFLKQTGCIEIKTEHRWSMPYQNIVYFKPTENLEKLIDEYVGLVPAFRKK